jgi:undecaprenyl-diphosphatase
MEIGRILDALLLGTVEGLTEFIPVSSTGHILLLGHFLGFENPGKTFEVLIQLGAILAIVLVYAHRLINVALRLPTDPAARRFAVGIVVAFLPAAVIGVLLHDFIKTVLFETPVVVCIALILGGLVLLWVDRLDLVPRYDNAMRLPIWVALAIGFCQCMALIPGVSRSGSTIVGALLLGVEKRAAAEFSFFLAMPTMAGAFTYDLYKNRALLSMDDAAIIGIGFAAAFISALIVVRSLLNFVGRRGYAPFAWWRLIVGTLGIWGLLLFG